MFIYQYLSILVPVNQYYLWYLCLSMVFVSGSICPFIRALITASIFIIPFPLGPKVMPRIFMQRTTILHVNFCREFFCIENFIITFTLQLIDSPIPNFVLNVCWQWVWSSRPLLYVGLTVNGTGCGGWSPVVLGTAGSLKKDRKRHWMSCSCTDLTAHKILLHAEIQGKLH